MHKKKKKKINIKKPRTDERDQGISIPPVTLTGIIQLHQILKQQNYDPSSIANAILTDVRCTFLLFSLPPILIPFFLPSATFTKIDYLDNLFELAENLPENDYKHKHLLFEIFKLLSNTSFPLLSPLLPSPRYIPSPSILLSLLSPSYVSSVRLRSVLLLSFLIPSLLALWNPSFPI